MSGNKRPGRSFRMTREQEKFVADAKVQTDAAPHDVAQPGTAAHNSAQHSTGPQGYVQPVVPHYQQSYYLNPAGRATDKVPLTPYDTRFGSSTYNFTFTPDLYAMALWCRHYVPGGPSLADLLRRGCVLACMELIEKHYKPEGE